MNDQRKYSETEAVEQVMLEGGARDFVDVVNAVKKRFQMDVTTAQVEDIYQVLIQRKKNPKPSSKTQVRTEPRISLSLASEIPGNSINDPGNNAGERSQDHLTLTLQFVQAVGGLANAKRALEELESTISGS